jgi:hypothetical protein
MTGGDWVPRVDIAETDKDFIIKADLPEVKKEEVPAVLMSKNFGYSPVNRLLNREVYGGCNRIITKIPFFQTSGTAGYRQP